MRSTTFLKSKTFGAVASVGERFGARPSALLGIADAGAALGVDLAAWAVLAQRDADANGGMPQADDDDDVIVYVDGVRR